MLNISFKRIDFIKSLTIGGFFSGKNKIIQAYECIKLKKKSKNNFMYIISFDGKNAISKKYVFEEENKNEFCFCINFKQLYNYVKLIQDDNFIMTINDNNIIIKHNNGKVNLPIIDESEFPEIKQNNIINEFSLPTDWLKKSILHSSDFIMNDTLRPLMNTMYLSIKDNSAICCATNSNIMYFDKIHLNTNENISLCINSEIFKCISELKNENVNIKIYQNSIKIDDGDTLILTRQIEGNYPDVESLVKIISKNVDNNIECCCDKKSFISAINRCKVELTNNENIIKIILNKDILNIESNSYNTNTIAQEQINIKSKGQIDVSLNINFLLKVLNNITSDNIIMKFSEPTKPILVLNDVENNVNDNNTIIMIMPIA